MQSCNLAITLMEVGLKLNKQDSTQIEEEKTKMVNIPYQNVVGSLMHVMISTWLDIAYVISSVAQYLSNFGKKHYLIVKRITRYLKRTMKKKLVYRKTNKRILS